eukprot:Gb_10675 [translate_table: standard]
MNSCDFFSTPSVSASNFSVGDFPSESVGVSFHVLSVSMPPFTDCQCLPTMLVSALSTLSVIGSLTSVLFLRRRCRPSAFPKVPDAPASNVGVGEQMSFTKK